MPSTSQTARAADGPARPTGPAGGASPGRPRRVPGRFLKHPVMVGSVIPSSRRLIDHMLRPVDWPRCSCSWSMGRVSALLPASARPAARATGGLIVIDTNPDFVEYLGRRFADSRFSAIHGSAEDVEAIVAAHGHEAADYVLSGLPFSTLPDGVGPAIAAGDRARDGTRAASSWCTSSRPRSATSWPPISPHRPRVRAGERAACAAVLGAQDLDARGRLDYATPTPARAEPAEGAAPWRV